MSSGTAITKHVLQHVIVDHKICGQQRNTIDAFSLLSSAWMATCERDTMSASLAITYLCQAICESYVSCKRLTSRLETVLCAYSNANKMFALTSAQTVASSCSKSADKFTNKSISAKAFHQATKTGQDVLSQDCAVSLTSRTMDALTIEKLEATTHKICVVQAT